MLSCFRCSGFGKIECEACDGLGHYCDDVMECIFAPHCTECKGFREIKCPDCDGSGKVYNQEKDSNG